MVKQQDNIPSLSSYKFDTIQEPVKDFRTNTGDVPSLNSYKFAGDSLAPPITKDEYFYETEYIPQIEGRIKDYKQAVREYKGEIGESPYFDDEEKQQRIEEIDMTITQLQQEQKRISRKQPEKSIFPLADPMAAQMQAGVTEAQKSREISRLTEEIKSLFKERKNLAEELRPVTQEEKDDILDNYGVADTFNDLAMIEKYGPDRALKIYREALNDKLGQISQANLRTKNSQTIFSYANIIYGQKPDLKYVQEEDLNKIWHNAVNHPDYEKEDYQTKRSVLYQEINKYISDREGIEDRAEAVNNIAANMVERFAKADDGDFTIEGVKLYAEYMLNQVNTMQDFLNGSLARVTGERPQEQFRNLEQLFGKESVKQWYQTLMTDLTQLNFVRDELKNILKMPEARRGIRDVGKGFKATPAHELMLGLYQVADNMHLNQIVNKVNDGKELSFSEDLALRAFATLNYAQTYDTEGTMYKASRGIVNMIPYIAQFVMTTPAYTFGKAATIKGATKVARKLIGQQAKFQIGKKIYNVADLAALNVSRLSGAAVQTAAIPQMTIQNTLENIRDDIVLDPHMDGIRAKVIENTGDSLVKGIAKGYWSSYSEILTERAGTQLMKAIPGAERLGRYAVSKLTGREFVERSVLDGFMKVKGIKSMVDFDRYIVKHRLGWNGVFEEYLEEVANYYLDSAVNKENRLKGKDFWENQLVTLLTVAGFGGLMGSVQSVKSYAVGSNVIYQGKMPDGEDFKVELPRDVHNDLMKVLNKPGRFIDEKEYARLLEKYSDRLSKEQFDLMFYLTKQEGENRVREDIARRGPGKAAKVLEPEPVTEVEPELTEEERKEVETENKRIEKEFPDLAEKGLLMEDPATGQYIAPTRASIEKMYEQVSKQLAETAEFDQNGEIIDPTPEVKQLNEQKQVLERYRDELHDRKVDFDKLSIDDQLQRIVIELKEDQKLEGTPSYVTDRRFEIDLKDGRKVTVYYDKNLPKDVREKVFRAIQNKEKVSLKLQHWEEWNPDLDIIDKFGVPYYDRVQAIIDGQPIGAVRVTDYKAERSRLARLQEENEARKAKADESFRNFMDSVGGIKSAMSDREKRDLGKDFIKMLQDTGMLLESEIELLIQRIIEYIRESNSLTPEEKGYLMALTNDNKDKIEKTAIQQQLKQKGLTKKETKPISIDELTLPELEGIAPSGAQKIDHFLNGYAPVWANIANELDVSKDLVERTFYKIAQVEGVLGSFQNQATLNYFLETLTGESRINDRIIDVLRRNSFSSLVSLFNFYSNLRLVKQYGMLVQNNQFTWRLLNPSEKLDEFVENFWNTVQNYEWHGYKGYDAILRRIYAHNQERDNEFHIKNQSYSWYFEQSPEARENLRREQHERDLQLLSEFTNIPIDTWREYFTFQTKETLAHPEKGAKNQTEYTTYDNLLSKDTWRNKYPRIQSNISFNLGYKVIFDPIKRETRTPEEFKEAFEEYFLRGNEEKGVLSNLYKLSTAIAQRDEIGLSGVDIKGDRFNSFVQYSHYFNTAENIRELDIKNHIVEYYRKQGKNMEIIMLNGVHNLTLNSRKKGTHNVNMSSEDLWVIQLFQFLQEGESYLQWLGQFGDKPAINISEVPKFIDITDEQISALKKKFPDFDEVVKWVHDEFIQFNQSLFNPFLTSSPKDTEGRKAERMKIARNFVYNYAVNIEALNQIFHGDLNLKQYKDLTDLIKRGGSTNSPGYRLNPYVEGGVGETFQWAMIDDPIFLGLEAFDGEEFMTGEYATRTQVSMGSTLSKSEDPEHEILSSVKALYSIVNPSTRLRGLTKTNRLNIETLANDLPPGNRFEHIRDFMRSHGIDVLSFKSGTKKHEKTVDRDAIAIQLWDKKTGELLKNPIIPKGAIFSRNTSDLYIQQDLRHSNNPKATKMPSQLLSNMLVLANGPRISYLINQLQVKVINDMVREFDKNRLDLVKLKWLIENVNQYTQPDLYRLLEAGMTPYEPSFANLVRKMIAGEITRKALEIPINRLTTQEILDPGITPEEGLLDSRRSYEYNGVKYTLLPDIAANIKGARYENTEFEGKPEAAIEYINRNKESHLDLFDLEDNLMEWEIYGRNGIIPGELIISTRVPASGLEAHTVARLKYKFSTGNYTMLDKKSQKNSGSDADGDQRFNQVFFKKNDNIIDDDSKEGIANNILRLIAIDYMNPRHDNLVEMAIDVHTYDHIVDKLRKEQVKYLSIDPRGEDRGRNENMVGVKMKGIMTDAVTVYSLIAPRKLTFRSPVVLQIGEQKIKLTGFVKDPHGLMRGHLKNFLNLAFDNAADPKIEIMGLNEITASMFLIAMVGDQSVDTTNNKAILNHIERITEYFTSPLLRRFTEIVRRDTGGLRAPDMDSVKKNLSKEFSESEVTRLIDFYQKANEFPELRRFYSLTQKAPGSAVEFFLDKMLYRKVKNNNSSEFRFLNVKNLFNENGLPVTEFASAVESLDIADTYVYKDSFDNTSVGLQIYSAIKKIYKPKQPFTADDLKAISYGLNNLATIRGLGVKQNMRSLQLELLNNLDAYREMYKGNQFLLTIYAATRQGKKYLEIDPNYRTSKIGEHRLARIREDFEELPLELKEKFAAHAIYRWGATSSTFGGSYYNLFSDKFRVRLSGIMQNEIRQWQLDEISPEDKLQIAEWIMRASRNKELRSKSAVNPAYANYYDYQVLSTIDFPVSYEALDGLTGVANMEELKEYAETHQFDAEGFVRFIEDQTGHRKVRLFARETLEGFRKRANELFPPNTSDGTPVKDFLPSNGLGEALISEDSELQKFIFDRLRKMYPGVQIFTDHDAFVEFVEKNGGRGLNIDPSALGHAFKNAIWINPEKAVQSVVFHEHAHIYWDALPKDNYAKQQLMELFRKEFPGLNDEQIEERIIIEIGKAGVELGNVRLRGTAMEKFIDLLKLFWSEVKRLLGFANKTDLVRDMTYAIWYNSDKINPDTNHGSQIIKNMISYNHEGENIARFEEQTHTHYIGNDPIPSVTTVIQKNTKEFDAWASAREAAIRFNRIYRGLTKEVLTDKELAEETNALMKRFRDETDRGTVIHAVAESVFGSRVITKDDLDEFEDKSVYRALRNEFQELKDNILARFPNAEFHTEQHVISKKYKIGGLVDLVIDTGNNELIVYDFKTTKEAYADDELKPLDSYKRSYGVFHAPFQGLNNSKYTKHMLQTNIYSNILEEQEDPEKPGKHNKVVEIRIVPIIRDLNQETGKIRGARISNLVRIPRNEKTISITDRMMKHSLTLTAKVSEMFPEFQENLERLDIAPVIIRDMMTAYHYFKQIIPDLGEITHDYIGDIRNTGPGIWRAMLIDRGFTDKDFRGPDSLTSEQLFYLAYKETSVRRDDEDFESTMKRLFPEQVVERRFKPRKNPDSKKSKWHRINLAGENYILEDVGLRNINVGDEIMMIYDFPLPSGRTVRQHYKYEVIEVDKTRKKVNVVNQATGSKSWLPVRGANDGMLRMHQELPEGVKDPGEDSYVPRYLYDVIEEIKERHYISDFDLAQYNELTEDDKERMMQERQIREIWKFFKKYDTFDKMKAFLDDHHAVENFYEQLAVIDAKFAEELSVFIRDVSVNHFMARAIQKENKFKGVPTEPLPMTLNLYYILTKNPNALWNDFGRGWIRSMSGHMTPRMIANKYVPLSVFNSQTHAEYKQYLQTVFELNESFKRFVGKIDFDVATMMIDGKRHWKTPAKVHPEDHPEERKFLDELYKYYEFFDPEYKEYKDNNERKAIPVSQIFATRSEMIERYGRRFGTTMREKLRPQPYDGVRLEIKGTLDEKTGKPIVMTLREIKERFVYEAMTSEEKTKKEVLELLGPRWRHWIKIPGSERTFGSAGQLNDYIKKAIEIYRTGHDHNNLKANIKRSKKHMPIVGRGSTNYATEHYIEAEEKAIDSMVFRFYMKKLMAPLDWMISMYTKHDHSDDNHALKYLKSWGEYQLYKKTPSDYRFSGETIKDIVDFSVRANSMNKIMFSIKTQFVNLAIGQAMNIIREPGAYIKGMARLSKGNFNENRKKAINILKRYKMANIVSDVTFDQIDKEYNILGMDISKAEGWGYSLMEFAERLNQFPIFIGLMTEEEWNSYDVNGRIKPGMRKSAMSQWRIRMIESRVQDIHGDYGTFNAAYLWLTNVGKAGLQFRKWLPAMVWAHFAPHHVDRNMFIKSGILSSIRLGWKIIKYNRKHTEQKQKELMEEIEKKAEAGEYMNEAFFESTEAYFQTLIREVNAGRITWKDLSPSDKRNLRSAVIEAMLMAAMTYTVVAMMVGDDESYQKYGKRLFLAFFLRFKGDVMWIFSPENWEYMLENLLPMFDIMTNSYRLVKDFSLWIGSFFDPSLKYDALYGKDSKYAAQGIPKWLISSTYILPGGSAARWAQQKIRTRIMKHNRMDLRELEVTEEDLEAIGLDDFMLSEFDIHEQAYKWKRIRRDLEQAAKYNALRYKGIDPALYIDIETGTDLLKSEANELQEALKMLSLDRAYQQGELDLEQVQEDAAAWRKLEKAKKSLPKRKIERNLEEGKEQLQNR